MRLICDFFDNYFFFLGEEKGGLKFLLNGHYDGRKSVRGQVLGSCPGENWFFGEEMSLDAIYSVYFPLKICCCHQEICMKSG